MSSANNQQILSNSEQVQEEQEIEKIQVISNKQYCYLKDIDTKVQLQSQKVVCNQGNNLQIQQSIESSSESISPLDDNQNNFICFSINNQTAFDIKSNGIEQYQNKYKIHKREENDFYQREVNTNLNQSETVKNCKIYLLNANIEQENYSQQMKQTIQGLSQEEQLQIKQCIEKHQRDLSEPPPLKYQSIKNAIQQEEFQELKEVSQEEEVEEEIYRQLNQMKSRGKSQNKRERKSYYNKMVPAFTNEKRRKLYLNDPKKGFNYINWDIEDELFRFQKEIESRFKESQMNKKYKYPLIKEIIQNKSLSKERQKSQNKEETKSKIQQKSSRNMHKMNDRKVTTKQNCNEQSIMKDQSTLNKAKTPLATQLSTDIKNSHLLTSKQQIKNISSAQKFSTILKYQSQYNATKFNNINIENVKSKLQSGNSEIKRQIDFNSSLEPTVLTARTLGSNIGNNKIINNTKQSRNQQFGKANHAKTYSTKFPTHYKNQLSNFKLKVKAKDTSHSNSKNKKEENNNFRALALPLFTTQSKFQRDVQNSQLRLDSGERHQVIQTQNNMQTQLTEVGIIDEIQVPIQTEPIYTSDCQKKNKNAFFQSYCNQVPGLKSRNTLLNVAQTNSQSYLGTLCGSSINQHIISTDRDTNQKFTQLDSARILQQSLHMKSNSNAGKFTQRSNHHSQTSRFNPLVQSLYQSKLKSNLLLFKIDLDQRKHKHTNTQHFGDPKLERNMIRKSSPTKTNLSEITKSCERQQHVRNYTLNLMGATQPNPYSDQKKRLFHDEQNTNTCAPFLTHISSYAENVKHHSLLKSSGKKQNIEIIPNEYEGEHKIEIVNDFQNPIFDSYDYLYQEKGKEFKCSIIEECVGGYSHSSSTVNKQSKQKSYKINDSREKQSPFFELATAQKEAQERVITPFNMLKTPQVINRNQDSNLKGQGNISLKKFILHSKQVSSNYSQRSLKSNHKSNKQSITNISQVKLSQNTKHKRNYTKNEQGLIPQFARTIDFIKSKNANVFKNSNVIYDEKLKKERTITQIPSL